MPGIWPGARRQRWWEASGPQATGCGPGRCQSERFGLSVGRCCGCPAVPGSTAARVPTADRLPRPEGEPAVRRDCAGRADGVRRPGQTGRRGRFPPPCAAGDQSLAADPPRRRPRRPPSSDEAGASRRAAAAVSGRQLRPGRAALPPSPAPPPPQTLPPTPRPPRPPRHSPLRRPAAVAAAGLSAVVPRVDPSAVTGTNGQRAVGPPAPVQAHGPEIRCRVIAPRDRPHHAVAPVPPAPPLPVRTPRGPSERQPRLLNRPGPQPATGPVFQWPVPSSGPLIGLGGEGGPAVRRGGTAVGRGGLL